MAASRDGTRAEGRAESHVQEGEKILSSTFKYIGRSAEKQEDAAEQFKKAAVQYKIAQRTDLAADFFLRAAECFDRAQNGSEAQDMYKSGADAFRQAGRVEAAVRCYDHAIEFAESGGQLSQAAKLHKTSAELLSQLGDKPSVGQSVEHYRAASRLFESGDQSINAQACLVEVGFLRAKYFDEYAEAADIFESVGKECAKSSLRRWGASDHFFRALLCHLFVGSKAADTSVTRSKYDEYCMEAPAFEDSRQAGLVNAILEIFEKASQSPEEHLIAEYEDKVREYDAVSKLQDFEALILLDVKGALKLAVGEPDNATGDYADDDVIDFV